MIFGNTSFIAYIFLFLFFCGVLFLLFHIFFLQKTLISYRYFALVFLLLFSLGLLTYSLFEPKFLYFFSQRKIEGTHISFVLDVSKSMNVEDIEGYEGNISRILGAKQLISNFVSRHPNNRYSLSIFSGESQRILPFTDDVDLFLTLLDGVSYSNIATGGSNVNQAMSDGAANFTDDEKGGVVVLLSDGGEEKNYQKSQEIAEKLEQNAISMLIVGIGTDKGGLIPLGRDVFGSMRYQIHQGEEVISKLNTSFLRQIASLYGAKYFSYFSISNYSNFENILEYMGIKQKLLVQEQGLDLQYASIVIAFIFFLGAIVFYFLPIGTKKLLSSM